MCNLKSPIEAQIEADKEFDPAIEQAAEEYLGKEGVIKNDSDNK